MTYQSTKTYGHNLGLSCAFRQWRADSHCHFLHGYAIQVGFVFEAEELDVRNWVCDFGSLKDLKGKLEDLLDHKTLVASDDPAIDWFKEAHARGIIDMREMPAVGCEKLAEYIYEIADQWLKDYGYSPRVHLASVEIREHGANSAVVKKTRDQVDKRDQWIEDLKSDWKECSHPTSFIGKNNHHFCSVCFRNLDTNESIEEAEKKISTSIPADDSNYTDKWEKNYGC